MIKRIFILIAGFSVLTFTACSSSEKKTPNQSPAQTENNQPQTDQFVITTEQFNTSKMELTTIKNYTFHEKVLAQGYLDVPPSNKAKISSYYPGKVSKINVLIGDRVTKGQELLRLTDPAFIGLQKDYLIAKNNLEYQTKEYNRQKQLASDSISSLKVLQMAKSNYTSALATCEDLEKKLVLLNLDPKKVEKGSFQSDISVRAPISGSVTMLDVTLGSHVNSSDVMMEIINNSHEHLELNVFEKDILKVKPGQRIVFTIPDIGTTEYDGMVKLIGKSIDSESRTVKVHGHLESPHTRFVTGLYVSASIYTSDVSRMAVPESALIKQEDNYFVLLLKRKNEKEYVLEKEQVIPGIVEKGMVQISGNKVLTEGMQVLSKGAFYLL
ncbi:MAG: efflux RND transporter periplasmic adaptor subunit [Bacteroidales bacterium]|nr:efflux RND transporter periplasmic adaptor subunit [Bacteroidales bacterium]